MLFQTTLSGLRFFFPLTGADYARLPFPERSSLPRFRFVSSRLQFEFLLSVISSFFPAAKSVNCSRPPCFFFHIPSLMLELSVFIFGLEACLNRSLVSIMSLPGPFFFFAEKPVYRLKVTFRTFSPLGLRSGAPLSSSSSNGATGPTARWWTMFAFLRVARE